MRSAQQVTSPSSEEALSKKAELCDALLIMLDEAGSRSSAREACLVIDKIIETLAQDHGEVIPLVRQWHSLTSATTPQITLIKEEK